MSFASKMALVKVIVKALPSLEESVRERMFFSPKGDVFAHEVCDGSARDKDLRWIFLFLSVSLLTRKNSYLASYKDRKSDTY